MYQVRSEFDTIEAAEFKISESKINQDIERRERQRKVFADENRKNEITLRGKHAFKVKTFNIICENLTNELEKRVSCY